MSTHQMKKHAILIMAHDEFDVLEKSILLQDDPRNDFYIHIDKKVRDFDFHHFHSLVKHSGLFFVDRTRVTWGGYSQINAELVLLRAAIKRDYDFFHLFSGVDLPIKSQDEIHAFFDSHSGVEFLREDPNAYATKDFLVRIQYYFFFQEFLGKRRAGLLNLINRISLKTQEIIRIDRTRNSTLDFRKGLNWFSITPGFVAYILSRERTIRKDYRYTLAADEVFIYTLAWNSDFVHNVSDRKTRFTKSGRPFIFRFEDLDSLNKSEAFWARKFSSKVDADIIDHIFQQLCAH